MNLSLTLRLKTIVDKVSPCNTAIDVGCDHAQVGICLVEMGKVSNMTVSDINEGPITRAREAVCAAGLNDKITCVRCDGLEGISPQDTVIIAGMGGELIRDILIKAPWTKEGTKLILQPMSMADVLRKYLFENGYKIESETIAIERHRVYSIMVVCGGKTESWNDADLYLSDLNDPNAPAYLNKVIMRLEKALCGMQQAEVAAVEEIEKTKELIESLKIRRDGRGTK